AAELAKTEIEARLTLGDFGILEDRKGPTFAEYAGQWLQHYAQVECKQSTQESYRRNLRVHLLPVFGTIRLTEITRDRIKAFIAEKLSTGRSSRGTIRLMLALLREILNHAIEDGLLDRNPALRLGRFYRSGEEARKPTAFTPEETRRFLETAREFYPDDYPLLLCALRTGLRRGELLALKWGDIQFGESEFDSQRFILVQRNLQSGRFTSLKSHKPRRVDLSRGLRRVLLDLRDKRLLEAFQRGTDLDSELVFPSSTGGPQDAANLVHRGFKPCLVRAGIREIRFHDLRHTFGSQLIQSGAPLVYVRDQMGHSSIRVTADIYVHLMPGANIDVIDRLDSITGPQLSATQAQPRAKGEEDGSVEVVEMNGGARGACHADLDSTRCAAG
ncbi:MAG: site-specific integrase, partial [Acidobacteria bacterium]|nr:site-specific integrase [Acidobacteriota bacterium]